MSSSEDFSGKVVLVTGASSGIGETLALLLASHRASVTLCGRNEARLEDVRKRCVRESGNYQERFITVKGDLQQADVRQRCVQSTIEAFKKLDVLINNAGVFLYGSCLDTTEEGYDKLMNINVKAPFFLIQQAVPYLEKTQGCVVTVSSVATKMCVNDVAYATAKAAVDHMTRCLSLDLAPKGIRVNAVNPSFTPTRVARDFCPESEYPQLLVQIDAVESQHQPLGHRCLTTKEVAKTIMFLASNDASFITGQCVFVDGGRAMMGPVRPGTQ